MTCATPGTDSSAASALVAQLRVEPTDGEYLAWADNLLAGPVEVRLTSTGGDTLPSSPALPARASVPAGGSTLVARLRPPSGRSGNLQLRMQAVPGSSNARPRDVDYLPPLRGPARIDQGFGGSFSHDDVQNRHALDFAADIGISKATAYRYVGPNGELRADAKRVLAMKGEGQGKSS